MKFEVVTIIDTEETDHDIVGEYLREKFFGVEKGLGCYRNFDFAPQVDSHLLQENNCPEHLLEVLEEGVGVVRGFDQDTQITCYYYWSGDGYLEFELDNGTRLYNCDCKKTYGWWRELNEE